ncbi:hypothetical protein C4J98_0160 [Pseudomonas orientalis]|nr:hypothetical protein C4J98_0160 [Pseudomonas orientalis]
MSQYIAEKLANIIKLFAVHGYCLTPDRVKGKKLFRLIRLMFQK